MKEILEALRDQLSFKAKIADRDEDYTLNHELEDMAEDVHNLITRLVEIGMLPTNN